VQTSHARFVITTRARVYHHSSQHCTSRQSHPFL
jgi:hypothetical protein